MLRRVLGLLGVCTLVACATGEATDPTCASASDCAAGKTCDPIRNVCVNAGSTNNHTSPPNSTTPTNGMTGNTTATNNDTATNGATTPTNNGSTGQTNGTTAPTNNTTPDPCADCEAPDQCVDNECRPMADCAAVLDECDASRPHQNGFTCVQGNDDGIGLCLTTCPTPYASRGCAAGEYCLEDSAGPVCFPSLCDTNSDCNNGTCVAITNGFNLCVAAGSLPQDAACDPSSNFAQCGVGQLCDTTGQCEDFCDPWGASCSDAGHYCGTPVSEHTSLCTTDLDPAAPLGPFALCSEVGAQCGNATECFALTSGDNVCFSYCRPGFNDCAGILAGTQQTVCDPYALVGIELGLCMPPCSASPDNCGADATCINQICRVSCTPGNEVVDCCGGTDCPAYCNPTTQLCE